MREIAELTDSAESTTRLRLYYARRAFARALADPSATGAAPHSTAAQPTPEPASPRSDQRFARCNTFGTSFDSLGEELERQQTPLGRVQVWTRSGRVLCTRYTGHIGPDLALCFTRRADRAIDEHGEVITFHDWTADGRGRR